MKHDLSKKGFATRQIHSGHIEVPGINPLATPIFQTSTFVFEDAAQGAARFAGEEEGYIYTRIGNPNQDQVGAKVAALENAEAGIVLGSGMGAISTCLWTILESGDHVVANDTLYGATYSFLTKALPRYGGEATFTDLSNLENLKNSLKSNTKVVYFETPANPNLSVVDIEAVSEIVHSFNKKIKVVVDNTFCTPYIQRPLDLGADVVVHSGTKYLNGHGDVISGMICGKADFIEQCKSYGLSFVTGASLSPFDAFLISRGLKTLDIRMEKHCSNAMAIAEFLEGHEKVKKVYYPGLPNFSDREIVKKQMKLPGAMISFELNASKNQSEVFINSLELCALAVSLGDAETLIQHPASMTHNSYSKQALSDAGITESMIRLSVGLETVGDLIEDLKAGLKKI